MPKSYSVVKNVTHASDNFTQETNSMVPGTWHCIALVKSVNIGLVIDLDLAP